MIKKNHRGFTLIEMTIVLALVAIVIAMTATFFSLTSAKSTLATKEYQTQNDLTGIEEVINSWVRHYDSSRYIFSEVSEDTISVFDRINEQKGDTEYSRLHYDAGKKTLTIETDGTLTRTIQFKRVDALSLSLENAAQNVNSGSQRICCGVTYLDSRDELRATGYSAATHYTIGTVTARVNLVAGIGSMIEDYEAKGIHPAVEGVYDKSTLEWAGGRQGNDYADPNKYYEASADAPFPAGSHYYNPITRSITKVVFDYYDEVKYNNIPYNERNSEDDKWYLLSTADSEGEAWGYIDNHVLYILTDPGVEIYATTMNRMFFGFTSLNEIENHNFHTDAASNWVRAFEGTAFTSLSFLEEDNWQMENVANMQFAFMDCQKIGTEPGNPDSEIVRLKINKNTFGAQSADTYLFAMFAHCDNIGEIDMSECRIKCTMFDQVFSCLPGLTVVTLPSEQQNFDMTDCTTLWRLFYNCTRLTTVNNSHLLGLGGTKCCQLGGMFEGCSSLKSIDLSGLAVRNKNLKLANDSNDYNGAYVFYYLDDQGQPVWQNGSTKSHIYVECQNIFKGCQLLSKITVSNNSTFFPENGDTDIERWKYFLAHRNCGIDSAVTTAVNPTGSGMSMITIQR